MEQIAQQLDQQSYRSRWDRWTKEAKVDEQYSAVKKCVRTSGACETPGVRNRIFKLDPRARFDAEQNPVTFWVTTIISVDILQSLSGVQDVIIAGGQ
jgi:hypothetical protein